MCHTMETEMPKKNKYTICKIQSFDIGDVKRR